MSTHFPQSPVHILFYERFESCFAVVSATVPYEISWGWLLSKFGGETLQIKSNWLV